MPHKPASKDGESLVFVSSSLTNERKPELAAYAERNLEDLAQLICSAAAEGYAVTIRSDVNTGYIASLKAQNWARNAGNKGKMLMERAGTAERAFMRLFWAHHELFETAWPKGERQMDDDW